MHWMGKVSAWGAMAAGATISLLGIWMLLRGSGAWEQWLVVILAGSLLFFGGLRSWRKMSGGLRLLTGAWGFAAGLLSIPLALSPMDFRIGALEYLLPLLAFAGLALTVLHKES